LGSGGRAELHGFLIPLTRFRNIGRNPDSAELPQDQRVICGAKCKGGLSIPGLRCAPERNTGRGKISALQEIHSSAEEDCNFIWIEVPDGAVFLCLRLLATAGRNSGFWARHSRRVPGI
jgi:hypothetical protein